jgi:hypothetical protein
MPGISMPGVVTMVKLDLVQFYITHDSVLLDNPNSLIKEAYKVLSDSVSSEELLFLNNGTSKEMAKKERKKRAQKKSAKKGRINNDAKKY